MANRIVVLGPQVHAGRPDSHCPALEVTALNASALLEGGTVRVCVSQYSGTLADATALVMSDRYVGVGMGVTSAVRHQQEVNAWKRLAGFLGHMHGVKPLKIPTPIPLWDGGRREYVGEGETRRMVAKPGDLACVRKAIKLAGGRTLRKGQNGVVDDVTESGAVVFKYLDDGTHLIALGAEEVEVVP